MNGSAARSESHECALLRAGPPLAEAVAADGRRERTASGLTAEDRALIARFFEGRWPRGRLSRLHGRVRPRKRWIIGARLPEGMRTSALPRELEQALTPLAQGFGRCIAGREILCIETATSIIVDVMRGGGPAESTAHLLQPQSSEEARV